MYVISLFSGAGGLDLGLEAAGFRTLLTVESNKDCRETIRLNRPAWNPVELHGGDVRRFSPELLLELAGVERGKLDVVAGGPPCQSFSNLGQKRGVEDERGSLVTSYANLVYGLRPKFFLFENVQGILQHPRALETLSELLGGLYQIVFRLVDAADFGVPQRRKRVIVLGRLGRNPEFPAPTHSDPRRLKFGTTPWTSVSDALSRIPRERIHRADNLSMNHSEEMRRRMALIKVGQNFKSLPDDMRPKCWRDGRHQGADTFGRLDPLKPSVTIRTSGFNPTKGRYIHPTEHRGLSTAEMAALQTFPHSYSFVGTIGSVGRQIGNAVPPLLAEHFGRTMRAQLESRAFPAKTVSDDAYQ